MQNTILPPDGTGAAYEAAVNAATQTLATCFSGAAAPTPTYDNQFWADTTNNLLKMRDPTNTSWIVIGQLGAVALGQQNLVENNGGFLAPCRNLKITRPSTSTLLVTADTIVCTDGNGYQYVATSVNHTINIATSGLAGGLDLDTGTVANGNWYHVWEIMKADGTKSAIVSLAYPGSGAIAPPTGYIASAYLGACYYTGGAIVNFSQVGAAAMSVGTTVLSGGTATAVTLMSLSAAVPQTARHASGRGSVTIASGTAPVSGFIYSDSAGTLGTQHVWAVVSTGQGSGCNFRSVLATAQSLWYSVNSGGTFNNLTVTGWEF